MLIAPIMGHTHSGEVLPHEIQWLVFIPHSPGSPALIEQVSMVFCPMGSYGILTSVTSL